MPRKFRIILAIAVLTALTAFFLDFSESVPRSFRWLAKVQILPAVAGALDGVILGLIIFAVLVLLTLLFGRVYCSFLCPLGILQDLFSRVSVVLSRKKRGAYHYRNPHKRNRLFFLLIVSLALLLAHWSAVHFSLLVSLLDPYSIFGRITSHIFYPLYALGNNLLAVIARHFGSFKFYLVDASVKSISTLTVAVISLIVIGFIASRYGRLYCNVICPVGTFLGLLSRYSFFRIRIDPEKCLRCRLCEKACKGSCIDIDRKTIDYSRCVVCFDCLTQCKRDALSFDFSSKHNITSSNHPTDYEDETAATDLSKRRFLKGAGGLFMAGNLAGFLEKTSAGEEDNSSREQTPAGLPISKNGKVAYRIEHSVSPPGAVSEDHLAARCTSCHLCIAKCPQKVIRPAFLDYGLGGMMLPVLKFSTEVFCNYDCTICGEVCPTGAIKPLAIEEKHLTQVGHVVFIKENCVVFTEETNCGACAEHCPTQAVRMVDYKGNLTIPETREQYCVGCGACESICPVEPFKAIHVEGNPTHKQAELPPQEEKVEVKMDDFGF